jgi:hypothetical protein
VLKSIIASRKLTTLAIAGTALMALTGTAGVAAAVSASSSSELKACVHKETGLMRKVGSGDKCKKVEKAITWNMEGDRGARGPAGPAGEQGDTGIQGETGEQGDQGIAGEQGEVGEQGEAGDDGDTGATGPAGPTGPAGAAGATGAAGSDGEDGVSGWLKITGAESAAIAANDDVTATATCTGGRKVLGGGYSIATPAGDEMVTTNAPTSDTVWTVTASSVTGGGKVTAYALCATVAV